MALIATAGATNANSYCTASEADSYFTVSRPTQATWEALTTDQKERYLIWATTIMEACVSWYGTPSSITQSLSWPRFGVINPANWNIYVSTAIPEDLKGCTSELALSLVERDTSELPDILGQGISEVKIGDLQVKIDKRQTIGLINNYIATLLGQFGSVDSPGNGDRVVRLNRA